MKVTVEYQIMKMITPSVLEIDESTNLQKMKERIYDDFWEKYGFSPHPFMEPHGSAQHVTLVDRGVEILNDDDFQERIARIESPIFEVRFIDHL